MATRSSSSNARRARRSLAPRDGRAGRAGRKVAVAREGCGEACGAGGRQNAAAHFSSDAGVVPRGARRSSNPVVRIENACLPGRLFSRLARAVRALGTENLRRTYRTTFWFDFGPPAALPEEAILSVRSRIPRVPAGAYAGVEWWLSRMRTSDVQVDFHQDRDEALFRRIGASVHPSFSSVLFLNRCRGGLLALLDAPANDDNPARVPDPFDADLVRPWPNRFVLFRGDATHGVLDANNEIPHGRLPAPTPLRLALVMNWWTRRPLELPRFARSGRYRALRVGSGAVVVEPGARVEVSRRRRSRR